MPNPPHTAAASSVRALHSLTQTEPAGVQALHSLTQTKPAGVRALHSLTQTKPAGVRARRSLKQARPAVTATLSVLEGQATGRTAWTPAALIDLMGGLLLVQPDMAAAPTTLPAA
jgi:hypothetical protein